LNFGEATVAFAERDVLKPEQNYAIHHTRKSPSIHKPLIQLRRAFVALFLPIWPYRGVISSALASVMMQGFYWDCPGPWYPTMQSKVASLKMSLAVTASIASGFRAAKIREWGYVNGL
jgi:hypothetical protein